MSKIKRRRKNKIIKRKRFLLSMMLMIFMAIGIGIVISTIMGNDKLVDASAEVKVHNNINTEEVPKEIVLDNSGYLTLEKDPNADDASIVLPETIHKNDFYRDDGKKTVYLTFDDGPSTVVTDKILDILDANGVKGTFFTLGSNIDGNPKAHQTLKRMAKNGHAIANHGYSHKYDVLYPGGVVDVKAFMSDMDKNVQLLKSILGKDFDTRVIRMPGGYSTWDGKMQLNEALAAKGYYQTDWNTVNGDAEGKHKNPQELLHSLKVTMSDYDTVIVLMHDTDAKENTVQFLQSAIDYLKSQGFEFKTLK
ncbi:MAG: polysaccharide deacetylase family protein [Clostridium sp.]